MVELDKSSWIWAGELEASSKTHVRARAVVALGGVRYKSLEDPNII
jgi:hypothetical protein